MWLLKRRSLRHKAVAKAGTFLAKLDQMLLERTNEPTCQSANDEIDREYEKLLEGKPGKPGPATHRRQLSPRWLDEER